MTPDQVVRWEDLGRLMRTALILDTRNFLHRGQVEEIGISKIWE
jgi:hypothetical protein